MKNRAVVILLQWTMLFGSLSFTVRASDGDLRALEARVERLLRPTGRYF